MRISFLLFVMIWMSGIALAAPLDSIRTEKVNNKLFVIHKVDPQETLFGLSRRYKVTVDDIKKHNPSLAEGLKIGDLLKIPIPAKPVPPTSNMHVVKAGETLFSISKTYNIAVEDIKSLNKLTGNSLSVGQELYLPEQQLSISPTEKQRVKTILPDTASYIYHVVQQGETLFGLGQVYAVDLENIRNWNNITGNSLSIGDSLVVGFKSKRISEVQKNATPELPKTSPPVVNSTPEIAKEPSETASTSGNEPVVMASAKNDEVQVTREVVKNAADFEEIVETGLAELIEDSGDSKKYLALHRTAKVGTIIRVHNEMNEQEVFVRVIGPLPDTGINDKVLIKISKAAYDRLAAIDKKFRVRISYFPD